MKLTHLPYLIILALLAVIFLQRECHHCPSCPGSDTIITSHTDTLIITRNHYLPAPPPDTIIATNTIFPDTAAILADYSALKIYNRTLLDDSTGKITLLDSVQFNALQGSQFSAVLFPKHTVETITHTTYLPEPPKQKVFAGISVGAFYPLKPILAPQVSLLTKKDHLYSLGYDPFSRILVLNSSWKIRLSRFR
jgi:hypothetical protein